jgi:ABC-type transporter Mla MlaB component
MQDTATINWQDGQYFISGHLNFDSIIGLYEQCEANLYNLQQIVLNLTQVKTSNSAGIALLVKFIRFANLQKKTLVIKELSSDIRLLAKAGNLDVLIEPYLAHQEK